MVIIGVIVMLQGFGSALARTVFDRDFGLLNFTWAVEHQPWFGIGVGAIGVLLAAVGLRGSAQSDAERP